MKTYQDVAQAIRDGISTEDLDVVLADEHTAVTDEQAESLRRLHDHPEQVSLPAAVVDQLLVETILVECPARLDDGTGTLRLVVEAAVVDGSVLPETDITGSAQYQAWLRGAVATISEVVESARAEARDDEDDEEG